MISKLNDKPGNKKPPLPQPPARSDSEGSEEGEEESSNEDGGEDIDENEQSVTAGLTLEMMEKELKALMIPSDAPQDLQTFDAPFVSKAEARNELTMKLVCQYCLSGQSELTQDEKYERAIELEELQLMLLKIPRIENLELFTNCVKLNLSRNYIQRIEGLETMFKLEKLYLQNNMIEEVENLKGLKKLSVLDLSYNKITKVDPSEIPPKMHGLNLAGNPLADAEGTRRQLVDRLSELKMYNSSIVLPAEAAQARGLVRPDLQEYQSKVHSILSRYKSTHLADLDINEPPKQTASYARESEGLMDEADKLATRMQLQHEMERDVMRLGFEARMQALQGRLAIKKELYAAQKTAKK